MVYRIEARTLRHIGGTGAVSFEADLGTQPALSVILSGVCHLEASGTVDQLDVLLSGIAGYQGLDLRSRAARIVASGSSWAKVHVTGRLEANASGTSFIRYAGDPGEIIAHTSGLGSIGPY